VAGHQHTSHRSAGLRAAAIGLLSIALLGSSSLAAHADDLGTQETAKQNQIAANAVTIQKNQTALDQAASALKASQDALSAAQTDLSAKQQAVVTAKAEDTKMATNLAAAEQTLADRQADLVARQADLATAQDAVTKGLAAIAAQRDQIGLVAQTTAQQNTTLVALAMLLNGGFNTASVNNQVQWTTMVFTANEAAMNQLQTAQVQLQSAQDAAQQAQDAAQKAQDAATAAEADVATQKAATAQHLVVTKQAQADATAAAQTVAAKVTANQQAQTDAAAALKQSQDEQAQYEADLASIQQQIQAEIEREKAAAAAGQGTPDQSAPSTGTFFQRPVPGPVTATFGWRKPPIPGASSYHQGVDFASPCGTPILASAAGTVTYAGWNGSLGNYVAINHGMIDGNYWSTGYGHQKQVAVHVGQTVSRGQVVGYEGTTGVSTGCHVHYNVFKNGVLINGLPLVS